MVGSDAKLCLCLPTVDRIKTVPTIQLVSIINDRRSTKLTDAINDRMEVKGKS